LVAASASNCRCRAAASVASFSRGSSVLDGACVGVLGVG